MNVLSEFSTYKEITPVSYIDTSYKSGIDMPITITFTTDDKSKANYLLRTFMGCEYPYKKELFYITAIKNLFKKIDFQNLNSELESGEITEEDFENRLETKPEMYLIDINENRPDFKDICIISDIVNKIERDFSVDDISELFSVDMSNAEKDVVAYNLLELK